MKRILIADDGPLFLELEKAILESEGYEVLIATNGAEVLKAVEAARPDLILMDMYMPKMNGDESCAVLKGSPEFRSIPVIIVTSSNREKDVESARKAGCDDYLTKPVNKAVLVDKVNALLLDHSRRNYFRVTVGVPVKLKYMEGIVTAVSKNIGRSGIYVQTKEKVAVGSRVQLEFLLPPPYDKQALGFSGKVVRIEQHTHIDGGVVDSGIGIQFVNVDEEQGRILDEFVDSKRMSFETQVESDRKEFRKLLLEHERLKAKNARMQEEVYAAQKLIQSQDLAVGIRDKLESLQKELERLRQEKDALYVREKELEEENREFAERYVRNEEESNMLMNLYVASRRLHSTLKLSEVVKTIEEIAINFIGAEEFALYLVQEGGEHLRAVVWEGHKEQPLPAVLKKRGKLAEIFASGKPYVADEKAKASDFGLPAAPRACIPMKLEDEELALLVISKLFEQKKTFNKTDEKLFTLLADHAATALFAARLYEGSERKRITFEGFLNLLTQKAAGS